MFEVGANIFKLKCNIYISKCNFRKSKLSLNNAFKNSLSVFIKSSFFIYINLIIIGLVYLFFGTHQIKNFGVTLTLIIFSNIIFCLFLMLIIWPISHYLYLDKNYERLEYIISKGINIVEDNM